MYIPLYPNVMFTPGVFAAVITAVVFCAALYLFHKKDPARGTRVDRFRVPLLVLSLLLTALFLFPGAVRAEAVLIDDLYFELDDNEKTATVVGPEDKQIEHATIPETITKNGKEYRVTSIGKEAFKHCQSLESVIIPSTVTSIGDFAFESCSSLRSVDIPSGVTSIGGHTFQGCGMLESVTIPAGVTSIGEYAFAFCGRLRPVIFDAASKLKSIGDNAFKDCTSLRSVDIPSGVTSIGSDAFRGCTMLESVTIQRGTEALSLGENVFSFTGVNAVWIEFPEGSAWDFDITPDAGFVKDGNSLTFMESKRNTKEAELILYPVISVPDEPTPTLTPGCCCLFGPCGGCRLPATGFSSLRPSALSGQPESLRYTSAGMRLMIPSLDVDSELVTVPLNGDTWAVEWLGGQSGILEGSALPGQGFSMVAAHNSLNDMETGPFALLRNLEPNDVIAVSGKRNDLKVFRVFANELLAPDDMDTVAAIAAREADTLVLVTCENDSAEGGYLNRRVVFAKP